jgi:hypothetical protein
MYLTVLSEILGFNIVVAICASQRSTERGSAERSPSKPHAEVSASRSPAAFDLRQWSK